MIDRTNAERQRRYVQRLKAKADANERLERENEWLRMRIKHLKKLIAEAEDQEK